MALDTQNYIDFLLNEISPKHANGIIGLTKNEIAAALQDPNISPEEEVVLTKMSEIMEALRSTLKAIMDSSLNPEEVTEKKAELHRLAKEYEAIKSKPAPTPKPSDLEAIYGSLMRGPRSLQGVAPYRAHKTPYN